MSEHNQKLDQPPIYQENITRNDRLNPIWQKWFTAVHQTHTQFFKTFNAASTTDANQQHVLPSGTSLTTAQRDNIVDVDDGVFIYNTTTNKFNFRENGAWKEIT